MVLIYMFFKFKLVNYKRIIKIEFIIEICAILYHYN